MLARRADISPGGMRGGNGEGADEGSDNTGVTSTKRGLGGWGETERRGESVRMIAEGSRGVEIGVSVGVMVGVMVVVGRAHGTAGLAK